MSWPMQNTGTWNPGMVMAPDMSMGGSYTAEQWAAIQQQNWQWSQWQQQYAQWQSQYGEKYAEQMQAIQAMGGRPPLPPTNTIAPPAPPPPDKPPPPPPPHENNQPLFGHPPSQPAPVPAPNVTQQQNVNSGNVNFGNQAPNNSNRPFPQASTAASVNAEALKKLAEEERLFDIQFQKWEEEIEKWRKDNVNHPDKQAYKEYEEKFEACRTQLLERRQQMIKKKARLMEGGATLPPLPQSASTVVVPNINTAPPPPLQKPSGDIYSHQQQQNYANKSTQKLNNEQSFSVNSSPNYLTQNNTAYQQQFNMPPNQNTNNKGSNVSKETEEKYQYDKNAQYAKDGVGGPPNKPSFLLASESNKKGIPGLDLVPETDKFALNSRADVIDITDDNQPQAPDYTKISKGINNILGDEKIMNILSMVRGQVAPGSIGNAPPIHLNQSGNYTSNNQVNTSYDQRYNPDQNHGNQQLDNRQNNMQQSNAGGFPMHSNQPGPRELPQQGVRPPSLLKRNLEEQQNNLSQNQYNDYNAQNSGNNMGHTFDRGFPPGRSNMPGPGTSIKPLLQDSSGQNNYPRGISNSAQQNMNDFSRGAPGSRVTQHPNDFTRGAQGVNDFPRDSPSPNYFPSGATGPNDFSRVVPPPNEFSRCGPVVDQQNITDYTKVSGFGQQNDYSRGPPGTGQQFTQDFSKAPPGSTERRPLNAINNIAPIPSQSVRPKWVDEPMFSPSLIVEYEHKPLRLKARDFIEPVHMFEYNHKSKDDDVKKKDFEKEVDEMYGKPNQFEKELDYGGNRYSRDYHSRDYERRVPRVQDLDDFRSRGPPRDEYDDRRRLDDDRRRFDDDRRKLDDDRKKFDDDRKRLDTRFDDRRRDDRDKFMRREEIYRDYDRDFYRDRDRGRDNRREDSRRDDSRRDDGRRDDGRRDDSRRNDSRRDDIRRGDSRVRSRSRDGDSRKRGLSRDNDSDTSSKRAKDNNVVKPAKSFDQPKHIVMIDDLLELPGREMRPEKIVIILRGPPGSGKSFLAKLIRDKEAEHGGTVRIMSIDDYYMQEGEVEEMDPTTGKMIKKPTLKYEYDEQSEEAYTNSLKRAFKRCLTDGYFPFVIYDAVNDTLKSYADIWNLARQNDFQVYICTMELDPQLCYKRNIHNRKLSDIEVICARFFPTPAHHIQLDATTLLQSGAITEVQMEDADMEVIMEDAQEPEVESVFTSKWEKMDDAVQLARLDGTNKPLRPSQLSMEDYLQLDDWKPTTAKPGKKTVRWADIEERRQQEKMRAIGFVVGQTDWNRMTDPTMGSSALTQTKYIERVRRH